MRAKVYFYSFMFVLMLLCWLILWAGGTVSYLHCTNSHDICNKATLMQLFLNFMGFMAFVMAWCFAFEARRIARQYDNLYN